MVLDQETLDTLGYQEPWGLVLVGESASSTDLWKSAMRIMGRAGRANTKITKRSEIIPCPGCGKDFERRPKGWLRSFCSDACRVKHHNQELRKARAAKVARPTHCGHCFEPIEQDFTSRARHFCNDKCAKKHKRQTAKGSTP